MTTIEMKNALVTKVQEFNALTTIESKTKAYPALTALLKELNKAEVADYYDDTTKVTSLDYLKTRIDLTAFDVEKNDDGVPCKVTFANKQQYADPYEVLKRVGKSESKSILDYGARYYALLQCQKLGINPDKATKLVGKQFTSVYMGKKVIEINDLSVTKVAKECLQPVFDLFDIKTQGKDGDVKLKANNIDVKFIDIGMAKHGKEAGSVVISNQKTYAKLLAEVIYCRLNGIKYTIA